MLLLARRAPLLACPAVPRFLSQASNPRRPAWCAEPARKAMPTAGEFESTAATASPASPAPPSPQPLTPSSIVKKDEQGIGGEPNDGRKPATAMSTMPGLPSSYGTRLAVTAGERDKGVDFGGRAAESRSASSHGGVAGGETGTSLFRGAVSGPVRGEQEQEKAAASGKFKRSGDGQLSLDQDVLLVKLGPRRRRLRDTSWNGFWTSSRSWRPWPIASRPSRNTSATLRQKSLRPCSKSCDCGRPIFPSSSRDRRRPIAC